MCAPAFGWDFFPLFFLLTALICLPSRFHLLRCTCPSVHPASFFAPWRRGAPLSSASRHLLESFLYLATGTGVFRQEASSSSSSNRDQLFVESPRRTTNTHTHTQSKILPLIASPSKPCSLFRPVSAPARNTCNTQLVGEDQPLFSLTLSSSSSSRHISQATVCVSRARSHCASTEEPFFS